MSKGKLLRISPDLALPYSTVTATTVVYGGKGMGKRLSLDTPLATPDGWTTMGLVEVGDRMFDERGEPCTVTYVSPVALGNSFRVQFSDSSVILADAEHLWSTQSYRERKRGLGASVRTTQEIRDTLITLQGTQLARTHSISNANALVLPSAELPIDPYVLGAWLGDGASAASVFTVGDGDEEIVAELIAAGHGCRKVKQTDLSKTPMYYAHDLKTQLRTMEQLGAKHLPTIYLRASVDQRLALLQGLMDTDGGWSETGGTTAEFSNTREGLSLGLYELIVSLGMKATLTPRPAVLDGVTVGTDYRVRFVPTMPVFRLRRKAALCNFTCAQQGRRRRRYITAIEPIDPVPMRCIAVDSPSHLYLAGRAMIPTHNTNFGAVLVEELSNAGLRWSVLDPMGVWWGMRHSEDGKGSGVECLILGGAHGDIPIEPTGGAVIADLVADEKVNVIIDISRNANGEMWSIGERIKFATDYGKQLFRRQGSLVDKQRREPICQIIDEAARFIPQMIRSGDVAAALCSGIWSAIVEEGRNIGLGVVLLTQRSARLNKDVAELADLMLAFRTVGPNSINAVIEWLGAHIPKDRIKSMIETVRALPVGHCLAVSPGWLETEKIIRIRKRHTFDSSATPKPGEKAARVKGEGAKPDLDVYAKRMKETIERASADDPKKLRKRIAELEAAAGRPREDTKAMADLFEQIEGLKKKAAEADRLGQMLEELQTELTREEALRKGTAEALRHAADAVQACVRLLEDGSMEAARIASQPMAPLRRLQPPDGTAVSATRAATRVAGIPVPKAVATPLHRAGAPNVSPPESGEVDLTPARKRILAALATGRSIGRAQLSRLWVAVFAGASPKSSAFGNNLGALRSAGLIDYAGGEILLTAAGEGLIEEPRRLSMRDAQELLIRHLTPARSRIMQVLIDLGGAGIDREELASRVGASSTSSAFGNNLGALRSLRMLDYRNKQVHATADLFDGRH